MPQTPGDDHGVTLRYRGRETFKVEVALEDIADQFVAAADLRMTCIESKLIIVDETRYR